jgi:hypothetical protein
MAWLGRVGWLIGGVLGVFLQIALVFLIPIVHVLFRIAGIVAMLVFFAVALTWASRDPVQSILLLTSVGLLVVVLRGVRDLLVRLDSI